MSLSSYWYSTVERSPRAASAAVAAQPMACSACWDGLAVFRFFSFLAQRKPQALHSVFGPLGPFLHSGESSVPGLN